MYQHDLFNQPTAPDYHNTNCAEGIELIENTEKAKAQQGKVLELYKKHINLSASQAYKRYPGFVLEKSVRRAISNLASPKDAKGNPRIPDLIRTTVRVMGMYKSMEFVYTLNREKYNQA